MLDAKQFAERLPGRVNRVLDALAGNELRLKVEMIDEGAVIDGLQKVANRIALGLVLAALIVAAAVIMQVPTSFRLLGYPGLAMILFIMAAGGGAMLAAQIVATIARRGARTWIFRPGVGSVVSRKVSIAGALVGRRRGAGAAPLRRLWRLRRVGREPTIHNVPYDGQFTFVRVKYDTAPGASGRAAGRPGCTATRSPRGT